MKTFLQKYAFFLFILPLTVGLRFYDLGGKQLWVDEIIQATDASHHSLIQIFLAVRQELAAAPLDFLAQHFVISLLGASEFSLRLHAAIFGVLAVATLYYLTKMIFDSSTATFTALLYAVYPLHHHYSQEGRFYALFVWLTLGSYVAFLQLLSKRGFKPWVYSLALNVLLFYTHYYAAWVLFSQLLFLCVLTRPPVAASFLPTGRIERAFLFKFFAVTALAALAFVPWIIFAFRSTQGFWDERIDGKLLLRGLKELSDGSYPLSFIMIVLACLGVFQLRLERKFGHLLFLLCWFFLPIPFIIGFDWARHYFFAIRQILFTTPALFILITCGIRRGADIGARALNIPPFKIMAGVVAGVALISVVIIRLHRPDRREDLRGAGRFLQQHVSGRDVVIAPGLASILPYYFPNLPHHLQDTQVLVHSIANRVGYRIYIVKSRYLSAADATLVHGICNRHTDCRTTEFRNLQIITLGGE